MQLFFENILQFSYSPPPPPTLHKVETWGPIWKHMSNLVYGVGEGWACVI